MKRAKAEVLRKINAGQVCQIVCVAARLGICDILYHKPQSLSELSTSLKVEKEPLRRFLAAMVGTHLAKESAKDIYELTEEGQLLSSFHEDSLKPIAVYKGSPFVWKAQAHLLDGLKTNTSPFELAFGCNLFSYLESHPEDSQVFQDAMSSYEQNSSTKILELYDFSNCHTLVDLGGGQGNFLKSILTIHRQLKGIVLDLPQVIRQTPYKEDPSLQFHQGSFFGKIPSIGDTYILRNILHDWSDEKCIEILSNIRSQIPPSSKVLVFETLIEKVSEARLGKFVDLNMFILTEGGKERTEEEFIDLFNQSGFKLINIYRTAASKSILEITSA